MTTPQISSTTFDDETYVVVCTDGYATRWRRFEPDRMQQDAILELPEEHLVQCRIVDADGRPAANVEVIVISMTAVNDKGRWDGIYCGQQSNLGPFWPGPYVTDSHGTFTMRGMALGQNRPIEIHDDRFACDRFDITAGKKPRKEMTISPPPARFFEGVVTCADTGKPAGHAEVQIGASKDFPASDILGVSGETDENGHFRLNPPSGKFFFLTVMPPEGEPYLVYEKEIKLAEGSPPPIEIALPRGILVRGRVTETASGEPVAGAYLRYDEHSKNSYARDRIKPDFVAPAEEARSGADGTFRIAVPPGRGTLFVEGPTNDYIYRAITDPEFAEGTAVGARRYANAFVPLDLALEGRPPHLDVTIRCGVTVTGQVVRPDGRPVEEAYLLSRLPEAR